MLQILALAGLQLRLTLKSRAALITGLAMPLLLTLIFGLLLSGGGDSHSGSHGGGRPVYRVALLDQDGSPAAGILARTLAAEETLRIRPVTGTAEIRRLMVDAEVAARIIIPPGFGATLDAGEAAPEVQVMSQPGVAAQAIPPVVQQVAGRVAWDYRLARMAVLRSGGNPAEAGALAAAYAKVEQARLERGSGVQHEMVHRAQEGAGGFTMGEQALGFTIAFVMMLVFMMGGVMLQEREQGTWGRILVSPVGRGQVLLGYLLGFFLTGWAQFGVLAGLSRLLFGLRWGNPWQLAAVASAYILCSAGLGFLVAGIVRSRAQQQVVGIILVNATSMLGGVYWPLDFVGETMRRIGYLTPQAWAMEAFRAVLLRGSDWAQLTLPLAVLLGMAAVFLAAGLSRVRFDH